MPTGAEGILLYAQVDPSCAGVALARGYIGIELSADAAVSDVVKELKRQKVVGQHFEVKVMFQGKALTLGTALADSGVSNQCKVEVRSNCAGAVALLLRKGADPNRRDRGKPPALVVAVQKKDLELVLLLLDKGANPNIPDNEMQWERGFDVECTSEEEIEYARTAYSGDSAIHIAAKGGDWDIVRLLLEKGADPDLSEWSLEITDQWNDIWRYCERKAPAVAAHAISAGRLDIVELLLEQKAERESLVECAINAGHINVFQLLLDKGVPLHASDINAAILNTRLDMVKLLVEKGAEPDDSCLCMAIKKGCLDIVQYLVDKGARPTDSALKVAVDGGHFDAVRLFLEKGARPIDYALVAAVEGGHFDVVRLLLEKGANPNARDMNSHDGEEVVPDKTVLMIAIGQQLLGLAELLLDHGADPSLQDSLGNSTLMIAIDPRPCTADAAEGSSSCSS
eukprot:Hpha_TRINITY_DN11132_c0_g1::TRINITY_DN11132_c0_g1_i1::g.27839::m.27839